MHFSIDQMVLHVLVLARAADLLLNVERGREEGE